MTSRRLAIGAAGTAVLLAALDAYVVVGVLIDMVRDLGVPVNHLERATPVVTGYLLGYVAAMPLLSQLSDRFGRRPVLQLCLIGFAAGSALTAVADQLPLLVAGRVLQGIAGGALLPVTMALVADLWSERRRSPRWAWSGPRRSWAACSAPCTGSVWPRRSTPGRFTEDLQPQSWRWVFWVNLPLTAVAMVVVQSRSPAAGRRASNEPGSTWSAECCWRWRWRCWWWGCTTLIPAHSVLPSWGLPTILRRCRARRLRGLGAAVDGPAAGPGRRADGPLLRHPRVSLAAGAALLVTLVNVELFAQTLLGLDSGQAALILIRFLIALPIGALLGGVIATRVGERWVSVAGLLIAAGGYLLISRWPVDVLAASHPFGLPVLDTDLAIAGLGLGLVIAPVSAAVLRVVPAARTASRRPRWWWPG